MTPELLGQIGEALYGSEWRSPLSRELGVHVTTVRRWRSGALPIPAGVVGDLRRLLADEVAIQKGTLAALQSAQRAIGKEEVDNG